MRYADATPEDLIRDMADIHPHIRLKAITTCARAAEYKPPPPPGIQIESIDKQVRASTTKLSVGDMKYLLPLNVTFVSLSDRTNHRWQ